MSDAMRLRSSRQALGASRSRWNCHRTGGLKRIGARRPASGQRGYHLHTTATMTAWDEAMAHSTRNGIQLDVGHYVAGTGISPVPFVEKHHARIFSMHQRPQTLSR
jgi:hypothetical protein